MSIEPIDISKECLQACLINEQMTDKISINSSPLEPIVPPSAKAKQIKTVILGVAIVFVVAFSHVTASQCIKTITSKDAFKGKVFTQAQYMLMQIVFLLGPLMNISKTRQQLKANNLSFIQFLRLSFLFWLLYTVLNQSYIQSLQFVYPSTAGAMLATTPVYIYIIQLLVFKVLFDKMKMLAILLAIAGNLMIVLQPQTGQQNNATAGYILLFFSGFMWASYIVLFKKYLDKIQNYVLFLFIGFQGLYALIIEINFALILNATNVESIDWAIYQTHFGTFLLLAVAYFIFMCCYYFGILITHPLFMSIGMMLDMPLNILYDHCINKFEIGAQQIIGSLIILFAFSIFVFDFKSNLNEKEKEKIRKSSLVQPELKNDTLNDTAKLLN